MSDQAFEIAELIRSQDELHDWSTSPDMYDRYAKAILAAGYMKFDHAVNDRASNWTDEQLRLAAISDLQTKINAARTFKLARTEGN